MAVTRGRNERGCKLRLEKALRAIEDLRDEKELQKDSANSALIFELNECLQVLRQYAGDTAENGLPVYVAFVWGDNKAKMGRYTRPALRLHQAMKLAEQEIKGSAFTDFRVVSTLEQCEALRQEINRKDLAASIDYYLAWCEKNKVKPFRYLK